MPHLNDSRRGSRGRRAPASPARGHRSAGHEGLQAPQLVEGALEIAGPDLLPPGLKPRPPSGRRPGPGRPVGPLRQRQQDLHRAARHLTGHTRAGRQEGGRTGLSHEAHRPENGPSRSGTGPSGQCMGSYSIFHDPVNEGRSRTAGDAAGMLPYRTCITPCRPRVTTGLHWVGCLAGVAFRRTGRLPLPTRPACAQRSPNGPEQPLPWGRPTVRPPATD